MLVRREAGHHLLVWVDVIAKIPQSMTEFLHVKFQQVYLASNVYELRETSFLKLLHTSIFGLWAGCCPIEPGGLLLRRAKQDGLKNTSAKEDHGKMRARARRAPRPRRRLESSTRRCPG